VVDSVRSIDLSSIPGSVREQAMRLAIAEARGNKAYPFGAVILRAADRQVGRELGVRYVLEGSMRKADGRVRITTQLIDATNGAQLWADRFDGSLADIFDLRDKVASSVAGIIEPTLQTAETGRSAGRWTDDLNAYDFYLRAYAMLFSPARQLSEAVRRLELAIARDPHYGPALVWAAVCHAPTIGLAVMKLNISLCSAVLAKT
jgi:hypothetical protein